MKTSLDGIALIKRFEDLSLTRYFDAVGKPTIGYGHLILEGEDFSSGITEAKAEEFLRRDLAIAEAAVRRLGPDVQEPHHFDALVSFIFNLGGGAYARSALRRAVDDERELDVPAELIRWCHGTIKGKRVKLKGLLRRRLAEASMYLED